MNIDLVQFLLRNRVDHRSLTPSVATAMTRLWDAENMIRERCVAVEKKLEQFRLYEICEALHNAAAEIQALYGSAEQLEIGRAQRVLGTAAGDLVTELYRELGRMPGVTEFDQAKRALVLATLGERGE